MKSPKKRGFGVLPGWWACGDLGRVVHLESTEAPSPFPTFCPMHPFHLASPELYPFIYISFYQLQIPQWKAQDTELGRKQFSVGAGLTLHKNESIRCHWKHLGPKDLSTCIIHKRLNISCYKILMSRRAHGPRSASKNKQLHPLWSGSYSQGIQDISAALFLLHFAGLTVLVSVH